MFPDFTPLKAALSYATRRSWHVFLVPPNTKKSYKSEEISGTKWGMTKDLDEIRRDYDRWPDAGVGIPTGKINGFFVVEADTSAGHDVDGITNLRQLEEQYGKLPPTLMARSPSGSVHYYFRHPGDGVHIKNSSSELAPGVDVRGDGGMVVAPPTKRHDGQYRWLNELDIIGPPQWLLDRVVVQRSNDDHDRAEQGTTDPTLIAAALNVIPNNDLGWDEWNRVGMATWAATGGSDAGFKAFDAWSKKSSKYDAAITRERWHAYSTSPPDRIGVGTLFFLANQAVPNWREVAEINANYALIIVGDKVAVMNTSGDDFKLLTVSAFDQWNANRYVTYTDRNGDERKMPLAKLWMHHPLRRQYEGITFAPNREVPNYYNLWRGFLVKPRRGDCSKFLAHLKDNVCRGDDGLFRWVSGWFAQIIQRPEEKVGTSLVFRGKMGTGKTFVGWAIGMILGNHYVCVADPRFVIGRFNSHLISCLLLHCDEAFWAGDHSAEGKLKDLITGGHQYIELKGKEAIRVPNYVRLLVTGNPDWLIPAGFEERRFAVLDVGEEHMNDVPYFQAIIKELKDGGVEALLDHFLNFDLESVDLKTIPTTDALFEQKIKTATPEQAWWLDTLKRGELPSGTDEQHTCIKKKLFRRYINHASRQGVRRRAIEVTIGIFLKKYVGTELRGDEKLSYTVITPNRGTVTRRDYGFRFPPLKECRERFADDLRQSIPWENLDEEWHHEEELIEDDDDPF
jgi:hypothetical protein